MVLVAFELEILADDMQSALTKGKLNVRNTTVLDLLDASMGYEVVAVIPSVGLERK